VILLFPEIVHGEINKQNKLLDILINKRKAFLIADQNTVRCRQQLKDSSLYKIPYLTLKSGEENKSINQINEIWNFLNNQKATRNDIVFLLGGGVICDMGAFAVASRTLLRRSR
jgi:3-dehydroquinate synthase